MRTVVLPTICSILGSLTAGRGAYVGGLRRGRGLGLGGGQGGTGESQQPKWGKSVMSGFWEARPLLAPLATMGVKQGLHPRDRAGTTTRTAGTAAAAGGNAQLHDARRLRIACAEFMH